MEISIDSVYGDSLRIPEVVDAEIRVGRELAAWQRVMKEDYWVCFAVGVTYLMVVYGVLGLAGYKVLESYRKVWEKEEEERRKIWEEVSGARKTWRQLADAPPPPLLGSRFWP